jgi:hypothetical protein
MMLCYETHYYRHRMIYGVLGITKRSIPLLERMAISIYNSFGNMCVIASMRARRLATSALSSQNGVLFNLSIHVHATNLAILTYYHLMHSTSTVRGTSVVCYNLSTTQGSRLDMVARACLGCLAGRNIYEPPPIIACTIPYSNTSQTPWVSYPYTLSHTLYHTPPQVICVCVCAPTRRYLTNPGPNLTSASLVQSPARSRPPAHSALRTFRFGSPPRLHS